VPYCTTDCLKMLVSSCTRARCAWGREAYTHGECTAKVIEDNPGTRVAGMIHGKICVWADGERARGWSDEDMRWERALSLVAAMVMVTIAFTTFLDALPALARQNHGTDRLDRQRLSSPPHAPPHHHICVRHTGTNHNLVPMRNISIVILHRNGERSDSPGLHSAPG
jgi:hypothetical protein